MKIFIDHLNMNSISNIISIFGDKLVKTDVYIQVYSLDGIYRVVASNIIKQNVVDGDVVMYKDYYGPFTLITDQSYFTDEVVHSIHPEHIASKMKRVFFGNNKQSNIRLVVEGTYVDENNIFPTKNHPLNMIPNNIYFEGPRDLDITDALVKEELFEFLSLLN